MDTLAAGVAAEAVPESEFDGGVRRWPRLHLLQRVGASAKARSGGGVLHNPVGTDLILGLGGRPRRRRDSAAQCGGSRGSACSGEPAVRPQ
jgi:hypothetical protein